MTYGSALLTNAAPQLRLGGRQCQWLPPCWIHSSYLQVKQCAGCSTVGNEDFRDVSLETQDGKPVVMSNTDREALVMGMTLHDKAQQALQKVHRFTVSPLKQ